MKKDLKVTDVVKFRFKDIVLLGTVIHITDYNTVNVTPISIDGVWSIPIKDIVDWTEGELLQTGLINDVATFTFGTHIIGRCLHSGEPVFLPIEDPRSVVNLKSSKIH